MDAQTEFDTTRGELFTDSYLAPVGQGCVRRAKLVDTGNLPGCSFLTSYASPEGEVSEFERNSMGRPGRWAQAGRAFKSFVGAGGLQFWTSRALRGFSMIDIHCHALPEVDDGAESFEIAVAMCRMAAADGITHLVATPHYNYTYPFQPEVNRAKLADLQSAVGAEPELLLGCDFHLSYDNIRQLIENRSNFTLNSTSYVLVEFGDHFIPKQLDRVFSEIEMAGLRPILTHPERNPVFQHNPELLYHWVTRGCLVQVTAISYMGALGPKVERLTEDWLKRNLIHFFASDAHDLERRQPILSPCYKKLAATKGEELADLLLRKNPEAAINGRPLGPGLEPRGPEAIKRKRGWLSFFKR